MDVRVGDRTVSPSLIADTLGLINALKNLRSHLRHGTIHVKAPTAPVYVAGATYASATIRVEPLIPTRVTVKEKTPFVAAGAIVSPTVRVNSLQPSRVTVRSGAVKTIALTRTEATVRIEPLREPPEDGIV